MRRWGLPVAIAAAAALALSLAAGSAEARGPSFTRAIASYHALQHWYYVPRHKLYKGEPFTHAWPFSQALAATVRMSELRPVGGRYTDDVRARRAGAVGRRVGGAVVDDEDVEVGAVTTDLSDDAADRGLLVVGRHDRQRLVNTGRHAKEGAHCPVHRRTRATP